LTGISSPIMVSRTLTFCTVENSVDCATPSRFAAIRIHVTSFHGQSNITTRRILALASFLWANATIVRCKCQNPTGYEANSKNAKSPMKKDFWLWHQVPKMRSLSWEVINRQNQLSITNPNPILPWEITCHGDMVNGLLSYVQARCYDRSFLSHAFRGEETAKISQIISKTENLW